MVYIKCIVKRTLYLFLLICFFQSRAQQPNTFAANYIYGKWKYINHYWWSASKFGNKEMDSIKISTLTIKKNKTYFDRIKFVDTCSFNKVQIKNFFPGKNNESDFSEDYQFMLLKYSTEQLNSVKRIELNCQYNCLGYLYLKQDTLILNFCGGSTIYLLKENKNSKKK
jgi:hypothetical protein